MQVQKQGLYYRFLCHCRLGGEDLYRLQVSCGDKQEDLGILVPVKNGFGLDKKIPVKRLGEGTPEFRIMRNREELDGTFIPIFPEEPFAYITRLKESYLVRRNGQAGILI